MARQVPRYLIVREKILKSVKEDDFLHNGRLPSEEELAKYFNVSRSTIRSALQSLESDGIVEKKHGDGNYIHLEDNHKPIRNASYCMPFYVDHLRPNISSAIVKRIAMPAHVAAKLGADEGENALEVIKRIDSGDIEIVCMHEFFPMKYLPDYTDNSTIPESIYSFFAMNGDIVINEVISDIIPIPAEDSLFLNLSGPVLMLDEILIDLDGRKVAYSNYYMNPKVVRPKVVRLKPPPYWGVK